MKKLVCAFLIAAIGSLFYGLEADALFGNTHFNLGKKMIESYDKVLTENDKNAFLSGLVYADIGRFKFDKETGIDSDSDQFVQEMKKIAKTSEEQWFVRGFDVHVLQDKETGRFLVEILGRKSSSYSEYIMDCGLIDSYFMRKNGGVHNEFLDKFNFEEVVSICDFKSLSKKFNILEDKIKDFAMLELSNYSTRARNHSLVLYDNLIKETYRTLGFEISIDEIHKQAANVVGVFSICSILQEKNKLSEEFEATIERKSCEFAKHCNKKWKWFLENASAGVGD